MNNEQQLRDCQKWMEAEYTNLQLIRLGLLYHIYLCYVLKKDLEFETSMLWQKTKEEGQLKYALNFVVWLKKCRNKEVVFPLLSSLVVHSSKLRIFKKLSKICEGQKVESQTDQQQREIILAAKQIFDGAIESDT